MLEICRRGAKQQIKNYLKKFFPVFGSKFCQGMFFPFQNAMRVIGLSSEQINDVHLVLASILQLGIVELFSQEITGVLSFIQVRVKSNSGSLLIYISLL